MTDLFTWIPRDAKSTNAQQKTAAGETASAIATFLANNSGELKSGQGNIGAVNPRLTQSFADVVTPYLSAMVGDDTGTSGFRPLDGPRGPMPKTAELFGVLNTDATAGNRLADAITTVAGNYEQRFADAAASEPASVAGSTVNLVRAARLLGLANSVGLHRADGFNFQPGDVVADLQYRIAVRLVTAPNIDLPQQFFKSDGGLMSPQEVRTKAGEFGWEDYTSKLSAYLAKVPPVTTAVSEFQREFSTTAASEQK